MMVRRAAACAVSVLLICAGLARAGATEDSFISGYASAILEREFDVGSATITVRGGVITLVSDELPGDAKDKVVSSLTAIRGVVRVEIAEEAQAETVKAEVVSPLGAVSRKGGATSSRVGRPEFVFLSQQETLFRPLLADPRWPHFSVAIQQYIDDPELSAVGSATLGETFPILRGDLPVGQWEVGMQAAVFAIFDMNAASKDLINADYWIGIPLAYRVGGFSVLGRLFHQSSHLGDEYLLRSRTDRVNLSYEQLELKLSQEIGRWLRVYGGGGYLFDQDPEDLKPWSTQVGAEVESPVAFFGELVRPLVAIDLQQHEETDWDADLSIRAGVQLESPAFKSNKLQIVLEFFDGHSPNGQFFERGIRYVGLGGHVNF